MKYEVLVIFKGGPRKVFDQVDDYGVLADYQCCYLKKDDRYIAFIPMDAVAYFGLFEEWEATEP